MKIRHFYHVWAAGDWAGPVREHIAALGRAGFRSPVTVGLTGPPGDRDLAAAAITALFIRAGIPEPAQWIEADAGFEQVTLNALRDYAQDCDGGEALLYAHAKGAGDASLLNGHWRRSMTRHVVTGWRSCVRLLEDGYDTAGCHWLTPGQQYRQPPPYEVTTPFYAGNFWWARSGYLRRLPPLSDDHRHQAEEWIGLGSPRAFDLLPGWPSAELCLSLAEKDLWQQRVARVRGPAIDLACAHADETCGGRMRWVSISREYRDVADFMPLCRSHCVRHVSSRTGEVTAG